MTPAGQALKIALGCLACGLLANVECRSFAQSAAVGRGHDPGWWTATQYRFPSANRDVTLPFTLDRGTIIVRGKVSGIPVDFVLDTGCRDVVLCNVYNLPGAPIGP